MKPTLTVAPMRPMSRPLQPALMGERIAAAFIDFILVNAACAILSYPFFKYYDFSAKLAGLQSQLTPDQLAGGLDPEVTTQIFSLLIVICVMLLVILVVCHSYYIFFESRSGQTPGKKMLNLRVVSLDGGPITRQQALTRELLRWYVDALFFIPAFIAIYSTVRRQRVGDIFAKTMVVRS